MGIDVKKLIGARGKTQNIPDGYLLDLSSPQAPRSTSFARLQKAKTLDEVF